jgi:hypothetical protein
MGWYGHAKPAGTALQRHLFTMVKQLKQYSAVYIKQPGEATPADCTPQKLLYPAQFWSSVAADTRTRVCIVPLSTLHVQPHELPADTLLVDTGLLLRTYIHNAAHRTPVALADGIFLSPDSSYKTGAAPLTVSVHNDYSDTSSNDDASQATATDTDDSNNEAGATADGDAVNVQYEVLTASEHSATRYTDQTYTAQCGAVEFRCDAVVLLSAAVEGCAVLDTSGLDWKISSYLQVVRRRTTSAV